MPAPGPSFAALEARWNARRCCECGAADVMAVMLPIEGDEVCFCQRHYRCPVRQAGRG